MVFSKSRGMVAVDLGSGQVKMLVLENGSASPRIGALGIEPLQPDAIVGGDVSVKPYLLGKQSPCPRCEYRSVCRFDVTLNGYNVMRGINRSELLQVGATHASSVRDDE